MLTMNLGLQKVYQTKVTFDKCGYLAFVDDQGGLQIGGGSGTFMINIHPITRKKTSFNAQVVPKKLDVKGFDFKTISVVVGPYIWIFGGGHGHCEGMYSLEVIMYLMQHIVFISS